jgi:hypothetical protein
MKALSIRQPWANLIAQGLKTAEIRSWATPYRGPLLICSGKTIDSGYPQWKSRWDSATDLGVQICTVNLQAITPWTQNLCKAAGIEESGWEPGYYAWLLTQPQPVDKMPVVGKLKLFDVPLQTNSSEKKPSFKLSDYVSVAFSDLPKGLRWCKSTLSSTKILVQFGGPGILRKEWFIGAPYAAITESGKSTKYFMSNR